jgi:hypothetical protein
VAGPSVRPGTCDHVRDALRAGLEEHETPDGVLGTASTWIVSADAPA